MHRTQPCLHDRRRQEHKTRQAEAREEGGEGEKQGAGTGNRKGTDRGHGDRVYRGLDKAGLPPPPTTTSLYSRMSWLGCLDIVMESGRETRGWERRGSEGARGEEEGEKGKRSGDGRMRDDADVQRGRRGWEGKRGDGTMRRVQR